MKRLTLIFLFLITAYGLLITDVHADIPHTINYQGKLTDKQGYALSGTYNVTFRLYDAPTAGNMLWQEAHTGLSVQKGLFSVLLGTVTPLNLPFDKQYYLSIQVGADPEMTPRQALASAPYAFTSETGVPSGTIMLWPKDTPPDGWLLCDGSAVSRTAYASLFAVIGTAYGVGDGAATFNLPDLRGRVAVGKDNMGGTNANRVTALEASSLGQSAGEEKHRLTVSEMPSHTHSAGVESGAATRRDALWTPGCATSATGASGGDQPHNNMQPYITLNYILKT